MDAVVQTVLRTIAEYARAGSKEDRLACGVFIAAIDAGHLGVSDAVVDLISEMYLFLVFDDALEGPRPVIQSWEELDGRIRAICSSSQPQP